MPMTLSGDGTITGLAAGGLPDGTVRPADLSTGAPIWDTSGNVGVGTSSPANRLDVSGTGRFSNSGAPTGGVGVEVSYNTGSSNGNITVYDRTGAAYKDMEYNALTHRFLISGSERARIDSSGNLLVGGTTVRSAGKISVDLAPASNAGMTFFPTTNSSYDAIRFQNNSSGQVGYITCTTTNTSYVTSSDYRLKENIHPMTGALAKVAVLKPCTYNWKADGSYGEGFIAHELAEVCPGAVSGEKDAVNEDGSIKPQGIDTSFLVATLTAAIQELKAEVDQLRAQLEAK